MRTGNDRSRITKIHLQVSTSVPGADDQAFNKAATHPKENCPASRLLKAQIGMDAKLIK